MESLFGRISRIAREISDYIHVSAIVSPIGRSKPHRTASIYRSAKYDDIDEVLRSIPEMVREYDIGNVFYDFFFEDVKKH